MRKLAHKPATTAAFGMSRDWFGCRGKASRAERAACPIPARVPPNSTGKEITK
jgi:hypothetical protein